MQELPLEIWFNGYQLSSQRPLGIVLKIILGSAPSGPSRVRTPCEERTIGGPGFILL